MAQEAAELKRMNDEDEIEWPRNPIARTVAVVFGLAIWWVWPFLIWEIQNAATIHGGSNVTFRCWAAMGLFVLSSLILCAASRRNSLSCLIWVPMVAGTLLVLVSFLHSLSGGPGGGDASALGMAVLIVGGAVVTLLACLTLLAIACRPRVWSGPLCTLAFVNFLAMVGFCIATLS